MLKSLKPISCINGTLKAPASKSMMQRAIAASYFSVVPAEICNASFCGDSMAALDIIGVLGSISYSVSPVVSMGSVCINRKMGTGLLRSAGRGADLWTDFMNNRLRSDVGNTRCVLNCGESGLCLRLFAPVAALGFVDCMLTGWGSLFSRPVDMMEVPLKALGVAVRTENGFPPVLLKGPVRGGDITVDGSVSSQFLTGLLMALPVAEGDSIIRVSGLKSKPYIDMTLELLDAFGIRVDVCIKDEVFQVKGGQRYCIKKDVGAEYASYVVEGDWSGASFLLVAGAVGGRVTVRGLNKDSKQADCRILEVLELVGAGIKIEGDVVSVFRDGLRRFRFHAGDCPDLIPPLAILACFCDGVSVIEGIERLKYKESNRLAAIYELITALGGQIRIDPSGMAITGSRLKGGVIDSHGDHRMAMAAAIASINAQEEIFIRDAGCVDKSYLGFFEDLMSIGGKDDE